jgi:phosphoglycerate dehydrogenase-like enzyme
MPEQAAPSAPVGVLVPNEAGMGAIAAVDGLRPLRYALGEPLPEGAQDARVLVPGRGPVSEYIELAAGLPRLRLVQVLMAGVEEWAGRLPDGLRLSSARGAQGACTAEWALAALLAVLRRFPAAAAAQQAGVWRPDAGETLIGKRVLVIGPGSIGTGLRPRLEACGAEVAMVGRGPGPGVHGPDLLPDLLPAHDAVVLALPLTEQTRGMVGAQFLRRMPDRAILVNAARGALVDSAALLRELQAGRLRAALDVTDPEPLPPGHPLWSAPGVLITPHVAGGAGDSAGRSWAVAAAQIGRFARGLEPENLVRERPRLAEPPIRPLKGAP